MIAENAEKKFVQQFVVVQWYNNLTINSDWCVLYLTVVGVEDWPHHTTPGILCYVECYVTLIAELKLSYANIPF